MVITQNGIGIKYTVYIKLIPCKRHAFAILVFICIERIFKYMLY